MPTAKLAKFAAMRASNEQTVKQAVDALLDSYGLTPKLTEFRLKQAWPQIAGPMIAKYTSEIALRKGKLILKVTSAPLRHQLHLMKLDLIEKINDEMGGEIVTEVTIK